MEASGVDPKDIRVLSLTNVAANNILQKNDKIQSMTIAKYISEIYKINYPKQEIVDYQTLKNTIMIYAYHKPNARTFVISSQIKTAWIYLSSSVIISMR